MRDQASGWSCWVHIQAMDMNTRVLRHLPLVLFAQCEKNRSKLIISISEMSNTYAYLIDLESLFEPIGSFVDLTPVTCHAT